MSLYLYNTLSQHREEFQPRSEREVKFYSCGPTVYSEPTIGNWRTYVMVDVLKRLLRQLDYKVEHILNITDVGHLSGDVDIDADDKILVAAGKQKMSPLELARFYEQRFHIGEADLNIIPADQYPRATENIERMIKLIEKLIKRGYAYEVDGNVYYDVTKFTDYGKLSGNTLDKLKQAVRPEIKLRADKKNFADFALWIKAPREHALHWPSPWGEGYPGWHIECSTMAGAQVDIHSGGEDNIFPHHEDEIAQSEAAYNKIPFAKYWFHVSHLLIEGKRMGKSQGNIVSLDNIVDRGFSPLDLRLLYLQTHYRTKQNFTWKALEQARTARAQIMTLVHLIDQKKPTHKFKLFKYKALKQYRQQFDEALATDLNTAQALAVLFNWMKQFRNELHDKFMSPAELKAGKEFLYYCDAFLGILGKQENFEITPEQWRLIEERDHARADQNYQKSDEIRAELLKDGLILEDTTHGTIWRKKTR